jgi:GH24 family phage-related lysozyme (muramidase)
MDIGAYYESSGRHIGTPYVDKVGKGQPLTVCNGVTGPEVVAGRYYTKTDCMRLELPMYLAAEAAAKRMFRHWSTYNVGAGQPHRHDLQPGRGASCRQHDAGPGQCRGSGWCLRPDAQMGARHGQRQERRAGRAGGSARHDGRALLELGPGWLMAGVLP